MMEAVMDSLKRQLNMIAECLPPSPFKASVEQVAANAIAELDRLTTDNAALTAENTRIFGMIDAREQTIAELTALCDGYRGEIEQLTRDRDEADKCNRWAQENMARDRDALTRARTEGLEESARIAEAKFASSDLAIRGTGYDIAAAIRSAAKGGQ